MAPVERRMTVPAPPGMEEEGESPAEAALVRVFGFTSRPEVHKLNRNNIYFFVNRRLVRDRLILHAITEAYRNILPASGVSGGPGFSRVAGGRSGCERSPVQDRGAVSAFGVYPRPGAGFASPGAAGDAAGGFVSDGPVVRKNCPWRPTRRKWPRNSRKKRELGQAVQNPLVENTPLQTRTGTPWRAPTTPFRLSSSDT